MAEAFGDGRMGHLVASTSNLATLLPPHAGKAVAASLGWWHTEVARALSPSKLPPRAKVAISDDDTPRLRAALQADREQHRLTTVMSMARRQAPAVPTEAVPSLDLTALQKALPRQGSLWRSLLTGETAGADRLQPDDYLEAAKGLAGRAPQLARRAPWTVWLATAAMLGLSVGAVTLIGFAVTGSVAGRSAAGLGGLVGALGGGGGVIKARTVGALKKLEEPLWGAELDRAISDAITLPSR
jgi:hypothetical protein